MVESGHKYVLRNIFRIVFVADQVSCESKDGLLVFLDELSKVARWIGHRFAKELGFACQGSAFVCSVVRLYNRRA